MSQAGSTDTTRTVREAVGVFQHWNNLQGAVDDLLAHGFDRSEISLLAGEKTVEAKLGHVYQKVSEIEDDPQVPRAAFMGRDSLTEAKAFAVSGLGYVGAVAAVGAVVASGGTAAAAILAAVGAGLGGAGLGTVLSKALGRERAHDMEAQLNKGGLVLWVRVRDSEHEAAAVATLNAHKADDVHVHDLPASSLPADDPLTGFEPDPFLPKARV
ncbi:MAG: hypothetical protein H6905_10155 [Hyphomicrobiales bacterium]|nr:hypothetical protein [Hyphomicrobiales bacterium]